MRRIFNEEKTIELTNPDLEHGFLRPDRLIKHTDEIPEKIIKTVEQVVEELKTRGKEVIKYDDDVWRVTVKTYPSGGKDVKAVCPMIEPAVPAKDEYEDIQVYHQYTNEEYLNYLRAERECICFSVINRGAAWYARLTPEQNAELQSWYQAWLDVTETKVKPAKPEWI